MRDLKDVQQQVRGAIREEKVSESRRPRDNRFKKLLCFFGIHLRCIEWMKEEELEEQRLGGMIANTYFECIYCKKQW